MSPNPTASGISSGTGTDLIPILSTGFAAATTTWVHLSHQSEPVTTPVYANEFAALGREFPVIQFVNSGGERGTLSGIIETHNSVTAATYEARLRTLIKNQGKYKRIWLLTPSHFWTNVFLGELSVDQDPNQYAASVRSFSLPFVVLE